jgi:hypothetical protein
MYDNIKEYFIPALRNVDSVNWLFDILFNSIKHHAEQVKYYLLNDLNNLIAERKKTEVAVRVNENFFEFQVY